MLRLILVILPAMAFAAAPRTQAANQAALSADEEPKEATVRASSEAPARAAVPEAHETPTARKQQNKVVSMAVDADGHISQGASKATPVTEATPVMANAATPVSIRANSENKPTEVPVAEVETKKEVGEAQPHAAYSTTKVPYGQRVTVHVEKPAEEEQPQTAYTTTKVPYGQRVSVHYQAPEDDQQQQEGSDNQASWKSVFFFFASIVLIVILAGGVATHLYMSKKAEGEHVGSDSKLGLKAHEASSGATALQQHLNDSSSTSDSGEKIAMLFDRVRKSLEDLGDQAPNDAADIAGAGKGGTQTNAI